MNLAEAYAKEECPELKEQLGKFISTVRDNMLMTFFCPICGSDVRSSFAPSHKNPWTGTCSVCHLGIQIRHEIAHEGHIRLSGNLCTYQVNIPVSLMKLDTCKILADKWKIMKLPKRPLTPDEDAKWLSEVQRVVGRNVTMSNIPQWALRNARPV
jgi:hypothetical protein